MTVQSRINVLVVEDHPATRAGLAFYLDAYPDVRLVGQVVSGEEALKFCEHSQPDVVLMDMRLPGMDGVATTRTIKHCYPHVQVVGISAYGDQDHVRGALEAGAVGYLLKTASSQEVIYAIRAAHAGRSVVSQEAATSLVQSVRNHLGWGNLTPRELEVMALVAEGLTNAEIAGRLTVTTATAKYHVREVLSRLGVSNRSEAIAQYWQHETA